MERSSDEKILWHDLDHSIAYALRSGVSYDRVIDTLRNKAIHVERRRDDGTPPDDYRRGRA